MSRRRSLGIVASCLSILSGCGGVPSSVSPRSSISPTTNTSSASESAQPVAEAVPVALANSIACAAQRASTLHPLQAGRGERVVLAKRNQSTLAFVANEDDGAIHVIDLDKRDEIGVTQLPGSPSALVLLSDGRLVVALRDRNELLVMESESDTSSKFETRCRLGVASEPVGLSSVVSNAGERVIVTSGYGHALGIIDAKTFAIERTVDLARDPRAVVISNGRAFVSHVVSADVSVVELDSGKVGTINVLSNKRLRSFGKPGDGDPVFGNQAFSLAMNERGRLFAPMVSVDPGEAKITGAYGSTETPVRPFVGVIDFIAGSQLELPLPPSVNHSLECLLPRAAAVTGDRLFVTCLGSDELVELDGRSRNAAEFMRRRVQLPRGPVGLALDGRHAVVMSQFDRVVSIVDVDDAKSVPTMITLSRPEGEVDSAFERGRQIFHDNFDPRVSKDGRACATCHPDGREDGFTWSTPDGPRQTISLAGRIPNAAPYGWFGDHVDAHNHLKHTVKRLGGQGFDTKDQSDLDALVTYISRMKAPVSVHSAASAALVAKGHAVFHAPAQGCGECHAEGGTDRGKHDIGTGRDVEAHFAFDTPSLLSIAGSAPYFHDGRYKSLDDLLAKADDKMGHAKHLNVDDRVAMVAYMESLSPVAPPERATRKFIRPTIVPAFPAPVNNPVEQLALRQAPPRKALENVELDLDALPVVQILPAVKYDEKKVEPQGGEIKKLLVWNGECASIPYHAAAHLQLDWRSSGMTRALEHCVAAPDPDGTRVWRDTVVQTVDPLPNGRLHVEAHSGFFRVNTHEFWATSSIVGDAVSIANGLAFAFRTNCDDCKEGEQQKLHIISPTFGTWGEEFFEWHSLRLDKNTSSSHSALFNLPSLERWKKATKINVPTGSTIGLPRSVFFRLDTSRTASEDKPHVAVGRTTCLEAGSSCL